LLSLLARAATQEAVETLARELAGDNTSDIVLSQARCAAEAEIDLGRVRQARLALLERGSTFGSLTLPRFFPTDLQEVRWTIAMEKWLTVGRGRRPNQPIPEDFLATMPEAGPERTLEAMRRVLPELKTLVRCEQRAAARRDRAIRQIAGLKESRD
jgi:hypothetical protein